MRRVSVVGPSGSGKSTVGRSLAGRLGVPFVELDSIHHLADWAPIAPAEFRNRLDEITSREGCVSDGNDADLVRDGPVWRRADTVVWLDLPRLLVMSQVVRRTVRRVLRREELWNGNRGRPSNILRRNPEESIIRWAWMTHADMNRRDAQLSVDAGCDHLGFIRLSSRSDVRSFLAGVDRR